MANHHFKWKKNKKKRAGHINCIFFYCSFVLQHENLDQHADINMTIQYWDGVVHIIIVNIK